MKITPLIHLSKRQTQNFTYMLILVTVLITVSASDQEKGLGKHPAAKPEVKKFVIDAKTEHQTIDNFSASDGWSMQYVGLWPKKKREQIADWLFSSEFDSQGNPKGIGLSLWRFNIGAGSAEQREASGINSPWRCAECFLNTDGTYNWNKQQGQRNFLHLAKQRGVDQFLGFLLSAPVYWTQNGLATNTGRDGTFNIKEDRYDDYARFMADVIQGIEKQDSITFDYICPFNEPDGHWNWTGSGQEGTAATKYEIAKTVRLLGSEFAYRDIDTEILVSESFDYNCMFRVHQYTKADRGYQIQSFFTPDSTASYIGDVPNVPRLMAAHSYWTNTPISDLRSIRMEMNEVLKDRDVRFWQTELCIMSNDKEIGAGNKKDLGIKTALYVARIIHHDLVYANASAWQWWRSVATDDYKDGLIYATPDSTDMDGTFIDSKLMWALGNYSRFIRPGAVRLNISAFDSKNKKVDEGDTDPYALMVSAFENVDGTPVVVVINYQDENKEFDLHWKRKKISGWKPYLTSDLPNSNLSLQVELDYGHKMTVPARSVVTYVGVK